MWQNLIYIIIIAFLLTMPSIVRSQVNKVDDLFLQVLNDPSNLSLNFALFQKQVRNGDLSGAELTLERVLILDPFSILAKILLAETRINAGKIISAQSILTELLALNNIQPETQARAQKLQTEIDKILTPYSYNSLIAYNIGATDNALGAL